MKVLAWYTKDTPYEEIFKNTLLPSLEAFNINYIVKEAENTHNWLKNVAQKPLIISQALEEEGTDLVVLDVDAKINKYPTLFDELPNMDVDIACHILSWESWYGYNRNSTTELLTGTMWIRNNDRMKTLCKLWYDRAQEFNAWEQKALERLIQNGRFKLYELPIEYCYINTLPGGKEPLVKCDPVITHYQASRELKRRPI